GGDPRRPLRELAFEEREARADEGGGVEGKRGSAHAVGDFLGEAGHDGEPAGAGLEFGELLGGAGQGPVEWRGARGPAGGAGPGRSGAGGRSRPWPADTARRAGWTRRRPTRRPPPRRRVRRCRRRRSRGNGSRW